MAYQGHPLELLAAALGVMRGVVGGVGISEWEQPTDLTGFDLGQLVDHVIDGVDQFSTLAEGGGFHPEPATHQPDNRVSALDLAAVRALDVWGRPGALDAAYPMPWGPEQGERLAAYLIIEVIGHAWDTAQARGMPLPISDDLAKSTLEVAQSFSEETLRRPGMFGPQTEVEPEASALAKLVSYLGRSFAVA